MPTMPMLLAALQLTPQEVRRLQGSGQGGSSLATESVLGLGFEDDDGDDEEEEQIPVDSVDPSELGSEESEQTVGPGKGQGQGQGGQGQGQGRGKVQGQDQGQGQDGGYGKGHSPRARPGRGPPSSSSSISRAGTATGPAAAMDELSMLRADTPLAKLKIREREAGRLAEVRACVFACACECARVRVCGRDAESRPASNPERETLNFEP